MGEVEIQRFNSMIRFAKDAVAEASSKLVETPLDSDSFPDVEFSYARSNPDSSANYNVEVQTIGDMNVPIRIFIHPDSIKKMADANRSGYLGAREVMRDLRKLKAGKVAAESFLYHFSAMCLMVNAILEPQIAGRPDGSLIFRDTTWVAFKAFQASYPSSNVPFDSAQGNNIR